MKKRSKIPAKILAVLLAVCLLASTVAPALAVNVDGSVDYGEAGLVVDGSTGWNSGGGDQYLLAGDFDVTITFENEPFLAPKLENDGLNIIRNWCNFVFEIFGGANTKGITMRADAFAWTYGDESQTPTYAASVSWDWDDFQAMCNANPIVTLNLKKTDDNTVTVTINFYSDLETKTSAAEETYTITYPSGVPKSMRVQVGADCGKVKILEVKNNAGALKKDDVTVTAFLGESAGTDYVWGDFEITYTFHNATQGTANYENFVFQVQEIGVNFFVRADRFGGGWEAITENLEWPTQTFNGVPIDDSDGGWATFPTVMKDADVTAVISRSGRVITFDFTITGPGPDKNVYHFVGQTPENVSLPSYLSIRLTGEKVKLSDIYVTVSNKVAADDPYVPDDDENYDPSKDAEITYGASYEKRVSVHDPSIVKTDDYYYIFGSHMAWARSKDLITWQTFENNINRNYNKLFSKVAGWSAHGSSPESSYDLSGNLWAPDLVWNANLGKWCMYMSVNGDKWYSSIVLLTADNIEGPYTYVGPVVYSGFMDDKRAAETDLFKVIGGSTLPDRYTENRNGNHTYGMNAIDPCVTYDEQGNLWMTYGSWFGGIYMLKLDKATGLRDYSYTYKTVADESDEYQGLKIAGGDHSSGEASYLEKIGNYWYLFMSYGGLTAAGGYNMRVFRSEKIEGPYVDSEGTPAIYKTYKDNVNSTVGDRLMTYYKWNYMSSGQVAQGHNSAFVDADGRAYVIYHTRFNNRGEEHQVRVHQLFQNENGWLVAAPFEYAGEKLSTTGYTADQVAGTYEVLIHTNTKSGELECVNGIELVFGKDGSITGEKTGTWAATEGSPYVTLTIDGKEYKGLFLEQKMEEKDDVTLCFTAIDAKGIAAWGYKYPYSDDDFIDMALEALNVPIGTFGQKLTLPAAGLYDVGITWSSDNTAVIADNGTVTVPAEDTTVILTATLTYGTASRNVKFPVTVFASKKDATEPYVLFEYFKGEEKDLSKAVQGTFKYPNPFNANNVLGVAIYNGVAIEFDVKLNGSMAYLSNILAFNSGTSGGLYFTGGSYLGFNNLAGSWFDANVKNTDPWAPGTDFLKSSAKVKIEILPAGFNVYFNDELAYTQDDIGGKVPGGKDIADFFSVLIYLRNTATDLNFGWGSWWDGGFDGTISNVKLSVIPAKAADTTGYVYYEDYNNASDTGWTSPNAQGSLSLKYDPDSDHGVYVDYAVDAGVSGNRGAYTNFPAAANLTDAYTVEADIKMTPGNVTDRSVSQFAIIGTDAKYGNNGTSYNDGIVSGYILKLSTVGNDFTTYYINDSDQSIKITAADGWVHVKATVNGKTVTAEITVGDETKTFTTTVNGTGTLKGLYLLRGRGTGAAAVDNIGVKKLDFSALEAAIADAEKLEEADYTAESWAGLEEALVKAKEVLDNKDATQDDVDAAAKAIKDAIAALVKAAPTPPPTVSVTGVTLDKTTLSLTEGETSKLTATVAPVNATNKTVTWTTSDAAVATVAADGTVTAVAAGTATITATAGGKSATCTVTVTAAEDPGTEDPGTEPEEPKVEITPVAKVETGDNGTTVSAAVTEEQAEDMVKQAEEVEADVVVIKPSIPEDVDTEEITSAEVTIPAKSLTELGEKTEANVTVETPVGNVTIPNDALDELGSAGSSVSVKVEREETGATKVEVKVDDKSIDKVEDGLKVSLPLQEGQVAVLVDEDGNETVIAKSVVEDGVAYVLLDGSATIKVIDNDRDFDDVKDDQWFAGAVGFASSHELFLGTGGNNFSPNGNMTRSMLVMVLWRLESEAEAGEGAIVFDDAESGADYAAAMAWASAAKIINGTGGNNVEPERDITRQELVAILYRYARNVAGLDTSSHADVSNSGVADWAEDAMSWAVATRLIVGGDNGIDPTGTASRAQVAIILQRLVGLMVK